MRYNETVDYDKLCDLFSQMRTGGMLVIETLSRDGMRMHYRDLRTLLSKSSAPAFLSELTEEALFAFCVFCELGFIERDQTQKKFCMRKDAQNRQLTESKLYVNITAAGSNAGKTI